MIVFPNCKINLGLHVLRKRPDNYHDIETIMYPISWFDGLEFVLSDHDKLITGGFELGLNDVTDNLVYKALSLLRQQFSIPPLTIYLHKTIPSGAGLGGGSSNASFMLKALNEFFGLNLSVSNLKILASTLGSDCPFFIENKPALAEGRGEILSPVNLNLLDYTIVVIVPPIHISTAEAYKAVKPFDQRERLDEVIKKPIEMWKDLLRNDFELALAKNYPIFNELKEELYRMGALYASLSGSGSSVYGIFKQTPTISEEFYKRYKVKVIEGTLP
ncbi:MAG TPA: 4-(cytidine 5'-diphospho)-2-C-methyl-D-erythritol kinase [Salinivirgaceae bacterium]|nr:4-(cytidine 5'-diphospho)-2-C-methyl-D-erythritol kinase [Salinivirgaceae bacterium]